MMMMMTMMMILTVPHILSETKDANEEEDNFLIICL